MVCHFFLLRFLISIRKKCPSVVVTQLHHAMSVLPLHLNYTCVFARDQTWSCDQQDHLVWGVIEMRLPT